MVVKLDPEHLGSVSIRLKMTAGKVDVSITVSDAHTLDVLNRDRHVLSAAVSAAGLGGDGMTLARGKVETGAATPATPDQAGAGGQQSATPQGGGQASSSSDPSGGGRRRAPRPVDAATPEGSGEAVQPLADPSRSGALYV